MSLTILGLGTATPPRSIAQADAATLAAGFNNAEPGRERTLSAIYRQTKIQTRGSVLLEEPDLEPFAQSFYPPAGDAEDAGPTTAARMERYRAAAAPFAGDVPRSRRRSITHWRSTRGPAALRTLRAQIIDAANV